MADADLDEQLFAYAAGELDATRRAAVEAAVRADPVLRAKLAWYEAVCQAVTDTLPAAGQLPSADSVIARARQSSARRGFFGWLAGPALGPVALVSALLIAGQAAVITVLLLERQESVRVRSAAGPRGNTVLVVAFDPEAREAAIRSLLLQAGASIVGGPRQLGEYRVAVPANRVDFATSVLQQSGIVEYVRPEKP